MRVILSRKGFDSSAGGSPSPIIGGRPVSLPIPERPPSPTTYDDLGLGQIVEQATRGRIKRDANCHDDPLFADGACWFGQAGSAQGHLRNQGVGVGDVFLFFGLFADPETGERHHRIFGYMRVACFGKASEIRRCAAWREPPRPHPHLAEKVRSNDTIYFGPGTVSKSCSKKFRLTAAGGPVNTWEVEPWLKRLGLSWNMAPERWLSETKLDSAKRGQEFVCPIGSNPDAIAWLNAIIREIET
jgi:hypothetical protein